MMDAELAFYYADHRLVALVMVVMLAVAGEIGFRVGSRKRDAPETFRSLMSGIGAATVGLLGMLLGFTLAMAIGRWDVRQNVIVNEANAIGTLSLRAGLFEQSFRDELRTSLRQYIDARIELGSSIGEPDVWRETKRKSEAMHGKIWSMVEEAGTRELSPAKLSSLITATNELIDLHESRVASVENFLPVSLMLVLLGVAAVAIYLLSWSFGAAGDQGRVAILSLGLLIGTVLFLIMDVNRPQRGTFQVGVAALERLRDTMPEFPNS